MRILIYTGTFKKEQDGVARATYQLVETLLKQKFQVMVASPKITPQVRKGLILCKLPSIPFVLYKEYPCALPNGKIIRAIIRFKPDIIHIATPDFVGIQILQFAKLAHIPVVSIHHTDFINYLPYYHLGFLQEIAWHIYMKFYNFTERTFAPTEEYARILESRGVKHVDIWSRGIDRDKFHPKFRASSLRKRWNAEHKKIIMYVGRFVWYKDLDMIYKVYERFEDRLDSDVAFVLIGEGPIKEILQRKMPKAIFPGYLHGNALSVAFASGDIFLFPSTTETFGQVIQEALSSGLPAIVSDKGGCKEIVTKADAGLIVPAHDVDSFYYSVKHLLDNVDEYQRMRQNGLDYAKKRTWDRINSDLIRKYRILATYLKQFQTVALEKITAVATLFRHLGRVS